MNDVSEPEQSSMDDSYLTRTKNARESQHTDYGK